MLDARDVYRKVTRKIFDFSPEQLANLTSIAWLYRGQSERFVALVEQHLDNAMLEADLALKPTEGFANALEAGREEIAPFFKGKILAPSSKCCPARMGWCTFPSWQISG